MPRTGQIIPPWFSPHEYVVINDNTVVEDAAVENIGTRFCNVFVGPKGIDNKLVEKRGIVQFVDEADDVPVDAADICRSKKKVVSFVLGVLV